MPRKNSDLEYDKRVESVIEKMTLGLIRTKDLLRFIESTYNLTKSQAEKDIREAKKRLGGLSTEWEKQQQKSLAIQRYNLLFNKNFKIQDYREARNVQAQLDKVLGNEAPEKFDVKTTKTPIIDFE